MLLHIFSVNPITRNYNKICCDSFCPHIVFSLIVPIHIEMNSLISFKIFCKMTKIRAKHVYRNNSSKNSAHYGPKHIYLNNSRSSRPNKAHEVPNYARLKSLSHSWTLFRLMISNLKSSNPIFP